MCQAVLTEITDLSYVARYTGDDLFSYYQIAVTLTFISSMYVPARFSRIRECLKSILQDKNELF